MTQVGRKHGGDFRERIVGGMFERRVGPLGNPARSEHEGFELLLRKHERRQHEARAQHITHARLAVDACALRLQ